MRSLSASETCLAAADEAIKRYASLSRPVRRRGAGRPRRHHHRGVHRGDGAAPRPGPDPLRVRCLVLQQREVKRNARRSAREGAHPDARSLHLRARDAGARAPGGRRAGARRLLRRRRRLASRSGLGVAGRARVHGEPGHAPQLPARPRGHGGHAVRSDAGRQRLPVPGHARPDPAPGAHAREPGPDRHPARRRALPPRDGRDEHRRAGRVPDLAAVARDVADADRRVAGRLRVRPLDDRGVLQPGRPAQVPPLPPAQRPGHVPAHDPRVRRPARACAGSW